jgi:pyruvate,water dikinase
MILEVIDDVLYAGPMSAGFDIPPGLQTVRRFKGRAFFDLTAMQWCFYDFIGLMPADMVRSIGGHQPEIPVPEGSPYTGKAGRRRRRNALRLLFKFWRLPGTLERAGRTHFAEVRRLAALNLAPLSNDQLLDVFRQFALLQERILRLVGLANGYPGPFQQALEYQVGQAAGERARPLMSRLLAGGGGITSAEQGYRIHELAEVARTDPAALAWLQGDEPTWAGMPTIRPSNAHWDASWMSLAPRGTEADILNRAGWKIQATSWSRCEDTSDPHRPISREAASKVQAEAQRELRKLTFWRRPIIGWLARRLQRAMALREFGKSILVAGYGRAGWWRLKWGGGWRAPDDSMIRPRFFTWPRPTSSRSWRASGMGAGRESSPGTGNASVSTGCPNRRRRT